MSTATPPASRSSYTTGRHERDLRAYLESQALGRYVAINVLTGEYALADSAQQAGDEVFAL